MSNIRRGFCMTIMALSTALGATACVAAGPAEGDELPASVGEQGNNAAVGEDVGEASQLVCEGYQPGAHCLARCGSTWYDLGNPGAGNCTAAGESACAWNLTASCWGWL